MNTDLTPETFAHEFMGLAGWPRSTFLAQTVIAVAKAAPLHDSPLHGMQHWLDVLANGVYLTNSTFDRDHQFLPYIKQTVALFALFHDCQRESEGECLEHGLAGAMKLRLLSEAFRLLPMPGQSEAAVSLAARACEAHTVVRVPHASALMRNGHTPFLSVTGAGVMSGCEALTIGICLDSDRLDLPRVGILPDPDYLYTNAAVRRAGEIRTKYRGQRA